mmetsp:Transcript_12501/g.19266  ORF Transcript_12501/g.19266 Transcript_12501/m.19266 type:complete len:196 (-) Transcript_12501:300-887(-)|eukprot:CAMPEP_0178927516 /NCGR_PEP_ID=MMETSP0786-20121207/19243_1 /TAXON_ID=186022 /ORGANISM="Thalassionema frauenfeldii, Strain CCMP 1798" /LENGTH=195 /DNA_ID=CAMNT_0020602981 /DNA_START=779 /DNA_END=1366 /DNA_ORIENTATION=-
MLDKFAAEIPSRRYLTPGTPGYTSCLKDITEKDALKEGRMERYRSGVGMLLNLVKHSRPDIANPVRELSKCMTVAFEVQYKEMLRAMQWVQQTATFGLKLTVTKAHGLVQDKYFEVDGKEPVRLIMWYLRAFCDASYASDKDKRLSVTGFIIYFYGAPVSYKSKLLPSASLSSSQSKYISFADVVKEILYVRNIL